jgi:hypothetical protein
MATGDPLPAADHVLRYVKPKHIDFDIGPYAITFAAFLCGPREDDGASVNWMEMFAAPVENQCACIRDEKRITYAATGKLARLNVGAASTYVLDEAKSVFGEDKSTLSFVHHPEEPDANHPLPHTSHSLIVNMPKLDTPEGEMIGALLRDCVPDTDIYDCQRG